jgi:hypothetical protein
MHNVCTMPIGVARDDSGSVIVTASGNLTGIELLGFINDIWASANAPILFDATNATAASVTATDIQRLADTAVSHHRASRLGAKLAIVTSADEDFGLARMFISLSSPSGPRDIRVFRSLADAAVWLQ